MPWALVKMVWDAPLTVAVAVLMTGADVAGAVVGVEPPVLPAPLELP